MAAKPQHSHPWKSVKRTLDTIARLQHQQTFRARTKQYFIEGVRNFVQAVDTQQDIVAIIHSEKLLTSPLARKMVRQLRRQGVPTLSISPEQFRTFSKAERASGISAVLAQRWSLLHEELPCSRLCWIVLGHVRSAGNLGTLIRTSEAIGGAGFILLDKRVEPYAPSTIRASMGAIFRQQFIHTTLPALSKWAHQHQCGIVGASPDGSAELHQFPFAKTKLIFLGEERQGLTFTERMICDHLVRIPMVGQADSLNVGVAGSLLMYELYRRQQQSNL